MYVLRKLFFLLYMGKCFCSYNIFFNPLAARASLGLCACSFTVLVDFFFPPSPFLQSKGEKETEKQERYHSIASLLLKLALCLVFQCGGQGLELWPFVHGNMRTLNRPSPSVYDGFFYFFTFEEQKLNFLKLSLYS